MTTPYDIIVIGGGLLGASVAYHLSRSDVKAMVIDNAEAGKATAAGAGILSPETNSRDPEAWFELASRAMAYYPELVAQLHEQGARETGYRLCTKLLVASGNDELAPFNQAKQRILERQQRRGLPGHDDLKEVTPTEAKELFPALAEPRGALFYRNAAQVDGRLLNAALMDCAKRNGVSVLEATVLELVRTKGRVEGVKTAAGTFAAGSVVLAAGAWSARLIPDVGLPVEPQRGQILHTVLTTEQPTRDWAIVTNPSGYYFVPWLDGRVVFGATRETGSGFRPHTTLDGVRELLQEIKRVAPGLGSAQVGEIRVGLRPATSDKMPVLGTIPGIEGLFLATGHGATGLQLGPFSGRVIAELITLGATEVDISAFAITRFHN